MTISAPDTLVRSLPPILSRRGLLTGITAVLSFLLPGALRPDKAEAWYDPNHRRHKRNHGDKHNHRHKHNHQHKRKHQQQTPPLSPPPPPVADPIIRTDATCASAGLGAGVQADANSRLAQTFTALASGALVRADLEIAAPLDSSGDFVLRLSPVKQSGETLPPTNDILAEATVPTASVPAAQFSTIPFSFATPFSVVAGTTYALVLSRPGGDRFFWFGDETNPCAGAGFFSPDQTAGFLDITADFVFATFVSS
jgi:hypothetical protein